jgi:ABC-type nitrate/sulfonate/bicarbonate transport system substrate-binding protein
VNRRAFLRRAAATATLAVTAPRAAFAQPTSISFASSNATVGLVTQIVRRLNLEAKYDLKLDLKILDPAAAEKTLLFRQVDAGLFPVLTAADLYDKGQEIVLFAPLLHMHTYVLVWNDSPVQTFADLRGKRIGALDKVSGAYRGLQVIAARGGLDFERDFQPVTGPPPALVTFLQRKQVDALAIHEPLVTKLLTEGKFRIVMGLNDEWKKAGHNDWLFICAGAHRDWVAKNRPAAKRLADMLLDALQQLNRNPDLIEAEAEFLALRTKAEIDLGRQRMLRIFPAEWNERVVAGAMDAVREAARLAQIKQVPSQEFLTVLR